VSTLARVRLLKKGKNNHPNLSHCITVVSSPAPTLSEIIFLVILFCLVLAVLGFELRASCLLHRHCLPLETHPQPILIDLLVYHLSLPPKYKMQESRDLVHLTHCLPGAWPIVNAR
jgi:hypothetical protein